VIRHDHDRGQPNAVGRTVVDNLLIAAAPGTPSDPRTWVRWGQLLPHILAADPASTTNSELRSLTYEALFHLGARGDSATVLSLAEPLHQQWSESLGDDDQNVLRTVTSLIATAYRFRGAYQRARQLDEDVLARSRRVLGEDHPDTLRCVNNLAR